MVTSLATFSNEDEKEDEDFYDRLVLEREHRPRRHFSEKQNHLADRLLHISLQMAGNPVLNEMWVKTSARF